MPFAGFRDFQDCIAKQKAKGHSEESANKICGSIKHKVEGEERMEFDKKPSDGENTNPIKVKLGEKKKREYFIEAPNGEIEHIVLEG